MRICFLGDACSVHLHKWIKYFKNIGWEVYVVSFRPCEIEGVEVICPVRNLKVKEKGGNLSYIIYTMKINKLIKRINPDIVNAHYITSYGLLGALTKSKILALSAWGSDILVTPRKNYIYRLITKYALKRADIITSDSENMSEEIRKLLDKKVIPVATVPMGIDFDVFRSKENFNVESPRILSLRTLNQNSNIDKIIKGFYKLLDYYPKARLTICNDGPEKKGLIEVCTKLGISDKVNFTGFVSMNRVRDLMLENDYLLSVPLSDATSVTLLEGMAVGIYPIVSDIPANREWITDGVNGSIVGFNEEEILNSILKTYKNVEFRKNVSEINQDIILKRATLNANMDSVKNLFCEKINK